MSLTGKVAIVTGGSKGIGRSVVQLLAAQGAKVAINYSSDSSAADELVASLGSDKAIAIKADAGDVSQIESLVQQTVSKFGKIDILVPNAGIMPMKTVETTTVEDFDRIYNVNVKGPYFLAQKSIPHMTAGSSIIFLSTTLTGASTVSPPYTLYLTTKGAIEQLTRSLSKDLGARGINVNCVAPGPTATDLFMRGKPEAMIKAIAGTNPFNRLGKPDEVAEAIVFLTESRSSWVAGQTLRVNGGMA